MTYRIEVERRDGRTGRIYVTAANAEEAKLRVSREWKHLGAFNITDCRSIS